MQPINKNNRRCSTSTTGVASQGRNEKVLTIHVVQHLKPGGIESMVLEMLRQSNANDKSLVVSLEGNRSTSIKAWSKLAQFSHQILFLNKSEGITPSIIHQLRKLFTVLKPDTVHTHHIGPLLYAGCAARLAGIKCVIHTEHDGWHFENAKRARLQNLVLTVVKPRLVADADFVATQLIDKFDYNDLHVIKNGIDCQRFKPGSQALARQKLKLPLDKTIIGCAGRLEFVKGQDILLHALSMLNNNVHVALAGEGSQRANLQELATTLGIEDRITWLGLVDDMPRFYQSLDLFCLPSRNEGFPLSTLEAQASGVPVVATNVGGVRETLCPTSGKIVMAENPLVLADALNTTLSNSQAQTPREFVVNNNDLIQMIEKYRILAVEAR
ncbi:glycosyltransferase [Vibrio ponticus]|uniref:Glycosyltransferase n=1 Tax=Vibrio ponticus TaxID=265668 RepID=A0A3N3DYZ1_9VIBR|nr:glycosyltransferase [Vibrio ponticus]ROV59609.1 glycosyltransferase [Vibrio ponticus]